MMRHLRNISELILYLIFIVLMVFLHEKKVFIFLADEQFLRVLASSATTLSGLGIGFLGIMLALREIPGTRGEFSTLFRKRLLLILRRSTIYFLISSLFAFLCYAIPTDFIVILVLCSALSTLLFLSGLLHMLYVCLNIEEAVHSPRATLRSKPS